MAIHASTTQWARIADCGGRPRTKEVRGARMDMFWIVEVLVATLCVIAAAFVAAVTADAVSRHSRERVPDRADTAASPPRAQMLTVRQGRDRDWYRVAIRAWAICVIASAVAVAAVGLSIIVE